MLIICIQCLMNPLDSVLVGDVEGENVITSDVGKDGIKPHVAVEHVAHLVSQLTIGPGNQYVGRVQCVIDQLNRRRTAVFPHQVCNRPQASR